MKLFFLALVNKDDGQHIQPSPVVGKPALNLTVTATKAGQKTREEDSLQGQWDQNSSGLTICTRGCARPTKACSSHSNTCPTGSCD